MDDFRDDSHEIPISLHEVKAKEASRAFAAVSVGLKDELDSLPLSSDDVPHESVDRKVRLSEQRIGLVHLS